MHLVNCVLDGFMCLYDLRACLLAGLHALHAYVLCMLSMLVLLKFLTCLCACMLSVPSVLCVLYFNNQIPKILMSKNLYVLLP